MHKDGDKLQKAKLGIKAIKELRDWQGNKCLDFNAYIEGEGDSESGPFITFETWNPALFEAISESKGKVIEADVTIALKGEYLKHKVSQVYIDGKPVAERQGRGYQRDGDSPEKRKSIEDQSRAKIIADLLIAGKLDGADPLVPKLKSWLMKLGESIPQVTSHTSQTSPPQKVEGEKETPAFKNVGALLTKAHTERGLSKRDVTTFLEVSDVSEITDFDKAWEKLKDKGLDKQ